MTPAQYSAWLNDPTAIRNVIVEAVANVGGTDTAFYLSVLPFASGATDMPPNQAYRAVLIKEDLQTTEQLSLDGSATMTIGEVGVDNADGAFDAWLGYVWTNRKISILHGDVRWARSDYQPIFTGVSADIGNKSRSSVNLKIRDNMERLNVAVTEHLLGGTTANQGTVVPLGFGEIVNITPLLIDPTSLQYQVHDGTIRGLIEVRDNGVPIANDTLGWSAVTVDAAHGTFRLVNNPAGTVTVSFQGDAGGAAGYVSTVAGIVKRIVTGYGYVGNRFADSEIDGANFTAFDQAHTQPVGLSVAGSTNAVSALQQVTGAIGAQLTTSRAGLLQLQQLDFSNLVPTFDIQPQHMDFHSIWPAARQPVAGSVLLSYCQNQTQQSSLTTSLPAEALSLLRLPCLTSTAVDPTTKAMYKLTSEPTQEDTILLRRQDADAEAMRRLGIRRVPRTTYQFDGLALLLQLTPGQAVRLFHPRFNLAAGATGLVVSMTTSWALGRATVGVMV